MDVEITRLENEIAQAYLVEKPRMMRPDTDDHTTTLDKCLQEFMTLLPWLRSHLTKHSNEVSALNIVECAVLAIAKAIKEFPRTTLKGELKSCTGGTTT